MSFQTPITIKRVLKKIEAREYVLPAIQREFVWARDQISALFDSLMRRIPLACAALKGGSKVFEQLAERVGSKLEELDAHAAVDA